MPLSIEGLLARLPLGTPPVRVAVRVRVTVTARVTVRVTARVTVRVMGTVMVIVTVMATAKITIFNMSIQFYFWNTSLLGASRSSR